MVGQLIELQMGNWAVWCQDCLWRRQKW